MKSIDIVLAFLTIILFNITFLICYRNNTNPKTKINKKRVIILTLIFGIIILLNNIYIISIIRTINAIILYWLYFYLIFNESIQESLIKTILIYTVFMLIELLLFLTVFIFNITSYIKYEHMYLLKSIYTILDSLFLYYSFKIKYIKVLIKKINDTLIVNNKIYILLIFLSISINILSFLFINKFKLYICILIIILSLIFTYFCYLIIKEYNNIKISKEKEENLLKFITRYEKLIDYNRINRHEMLNNLLILKSIKNKNSKNFELTLNNIINMYKSSDTRNISSLYKLPSGLKGIIYYKINSIEQNEINFYINVSPYIEKKLNQLNNKIYYDICKIIGILLDNSIEAAKETETKIISIDIYKEQKNIIFYIENSCKTGINLNKINTKGYSSKGRNRGYGLYITKEIINKNELLTLKQEIIEDKFISKLIIKAN